MLKLVMGNSRKPALPLPLPTVDDIFTQRHNMRRLVLKMLSSHPDREGIAEDLVQDAMVKAIKALPRFRGSCKFSSWMYRVAYTTTLDYLRSQKRLPEHSLSFPQHRDANSGHETDGPADLLESLAVAVNHSEEKLIAKLDFQRVMAAIKNLPPSQFRIVILKLADERTLVEIARIEGIGLSGVKARYYKALTKLRLNLQEF